MKVLFISGLYPKEREKELAELSSNILQNAANVFQWAVVDGLSKNKADFDVVTLPFLPAFPNTYKHLYTPSGDIFFEEKKIGTMVSYCNLLVFKTISITTNLKRFVGQWIKNNSSEKHLVLLTYSPYFPFIDAIKEFKSENVSIASFVTDLVDDMGSFSANQRLLKRIQSRYETNKTKLAYHSIDKFILLSKAMEEKIPQSVGHNTVIEGISIINEKEFKHVDKTDKFILYTGSLETYSCVDILIKAFLRLQHKNVRLVICGSGVLESYIKNLSKINNNIDFLGIVSRDKAIELQQAATILINPRMPNNNITRYSFPSKTMEYMTSGTPMIGYKLEGIPEEYYNYYYTVDSTEIESLVETLDSVLSKGQVELNEKALQAYNFIKNNKSSQQQVNKILDFLKK